jgi:hypothetical protein
MRRTVPRTLAAAALCCLAACDASPSDPTGSAGQYALVQYGDQSIPMQLRRPAGWQGLFCADLVQSQVLDLRRDRTASLFTRTSFQCEDGRTPVPDSSRYSGRYRASTDSVIVTFPSSTTAVDSISWPMSRAGDRLIYTLGPVYSVGGTVADTFRLVYQRTR